MSPILRPTHANKKVMEEVVTKPAVTVINESGVHIPLPDTQVNQVVNMESHPVSVSEDVDNDTAKDEKISVVLQEILDRKIDKAIVNAEAEINNIIPKVVPTEVVVSTPISVTNDDLAMTTTPFEQVTVPLVPPVSTAGQEIHVSVPVEDIHPAVEVASAAVIATPTETLPVAQSINVIPINAVPTEIVPAPALPSQAITQEVSNASAVVPQKVHWFDKLFGSTPAAPPQSA